jgi:hypothetical protein
MRWRRDWNARAEQLARENASTDAAAGASVSTPGGLSTATAPGNCFDGAPDVSPANAAYMPGSATALPAARLTFGGARLGAPSDALTLGAVEALQAHAQALAQAPAPAQALGPVQASTLALEARCAELESLLAAEQNHVGDLDRKLKEALVAANLAVCEAGDAAAARERCSELERQLAHAMLMNTIYTVAADEQCCCAPVAPAPSVAAMRAAADARSRRGRAPAGEACVASEASACDDDEEECKSARSCRSPVAVDGAPTQGRAPLTFTAPRADTLTTAAERVLLLCALTPSSSSADADKGAPAGPYSVDSARSRLELERNIAITRLTEVQRELAESKLEVASLRRQLTVAGAGAGQNLVVQGRSFAARAETERCRTRRWAAAAGQGQESFMAEVDELLARAHACLAALAGGGVSAAAGGAEGAQAHVAGE